MPLQAPKCDICGQSDAQLNCTHCEANFCHPCDQKTHMGKLKSHQRTACTGTDLPSRFCSVTGHEGQNLPVYCQTCLKPICALCLLGEHKTHSNLPIKSAVENVKSIIKDNLVPIQANMAKIDQEIKVMEEDMKKLEEKIKEAKKRRNEENQKLEDLKLWLNKPDVDPYVFLSLVSDLKLETKLQELQGYGAPGSRFADGFTMTSLEGEWSWGSGDHVNTSDRIVHTDLENMTGILTGARITQYKSGDDYKLPRGGNERCGIYSNPKSDPHAFNLKFTKGQAVLRGFRFFCTRIERAVTLRVFTRKSGTQSWGDNLYSANSLPCLTTGGNQKQWVEVQFQKHTQCEEFRVEIRGGQCAFHTINFINGP